MLIKNRSIFRAGITVDEEKNCFLAFNSLCEKYNTKFNFLQYYSILSSIPSSWKKLSNSNERPHIASVRIRIRIALISDSLTCKALYKKLLSLEKLPPPTAEKKLIEYGLEKNNLSKVYLLPFNVTKETKLIMFQYHSRSFIAFYPQIVYCIK